MAVHDFKSQRLYLDASLAVGVSIEATREQANYLLNVLRLETGAQMLVFNGRDGEWLVEIEQAGRKKCTLLAIEQTRQQPAPSNLTYCFAPLKQARLDYMIQKAVEMGVGVLQPVITQHTQVRKLNTKRIEANAIEAAEQCGILALPRIKEPISFNSLLSDHDSSNTLIVCDEGEPRAECLDDLKRVRGSDITLLVGPEGGFSQEERASFSQSNIITLGLGPRILRADTAAVAALALIQAHSGDWYEIEK